MKRVTVDIQNHDRDDTLQVVHNSAYLHDNLAIEAFRIPDWLGVSPLRGVIAAGGYADVKISLDAVGLADGDREGIITVAPNDPFNGLIPVPVLLHAGAVGLDDLNVDPNTLNLSSNGTTVRVALQPRPQDNPADVVISRVSLNGIVLATPHPVAHGDENADGILELVLKFDRSAFEAAVPEGDDIPVTATGEVENTTWFTGTDTIRAIPPRMTAPNGGEYFYVGQAITISWEHRPPTSCWGTTCSSAGTAAAPGRAWPPGSRRGRSPGP